MNTLFQNHQRLLRNLSSVYQREVFKKLKSEHRITGIVGPRGIGKTTYLLNLIKREYADSNQALYISADDLYFAKNNLISVAEEFINTYNGKLLCIDEIHKYPNWSQELKNIYDKHKDLTIIFSGSSAIDLIKQKYDLSRRAVLRYLPGFSFREYLEIKQNKNFPILSLEEIIAKRITSYEELLKIPKLLGYFNDYLKVGYYPIFNEFKQQEEIFEALWGIIEKSIYIDVASYYKLKTTTLPVLKRIIYFIYTSAPGSINVNRIAKSLNKDHSDISGYMEMLRDTGLLRFLLIDKTGHALIRNAEKIYLNNTNLAFVLEKEIGKPVGRGSIRELFTLVNLENAGLKPFYSKVGDLRCDKFIFEIGGKNKGVSQIVGQENAFLVCDDILNGENKKIPLYLFGFLY